jgi:hypothetical protein
MLLALINLVLLLWLLYFVLKIKFLDCKCAITPIYYFIVYYIVLSLGVTVFGSYIEKNINTSMLMLVVYLVSTIVFLTLLFKYVKDIETCVCATSGAIPLQILFWIRLISLVLALSAIVNLISGILKSGKK